MSVRASVASLKRHMAEMKKARSNGNIGRAARMLQLHREHELSPAPPDTVESLEKKLATCARGGRAYRMTARGLRYELGVRLATLEPGSLAHQITAQRIHNLQMGTDR